MVKKLDVSLSIKYTLPDLMFDNSITNEEISFLFKELYKEITSDNFDGQKVVKAENEHISLIFKENNRNNYIKAGNVKEICVNRMVFLNKCYVDILFPGRVTKTILKTYNIPIPTIPEIDPLNPNIKPGDFPPCPFGTVTANDEGGY
jgi:hypothetical protein